MPLLAVRSLLRFLIFFWNILGAWGNKVNFRREINHVNFFQVVSTKEKKGGISKPSADFSWSSRILPTQRKSREVNTKLQSFKPKRQRSHFLALNIFSKLMAGLEWILWNCHMWTFLLPVVLDFSRTSSFFLGLWRRVLEFEFKLLGSRFLNKSFVNAEHHENSKNLKNHQKPRPEQVSLRPI